ncbi:MAG TPA: PilZ domain-containing protein [Candidatus Gastranaerophilaceae bacterium]|nr:PilZ domain-containing protein [Candidatus Gastranaerophilaceae bacterium]
MGEVRRNQKIQISFKTNDGTEKIFECKIKELYSDRLMLDYPKDIVFYAEYLSEGEEIYVKIFTPAGIRAYNALILDSPLSENFIIEYVDSNIQIQRRAYARAPLKTKIIIERFDEPNIVTHTVDIGGGGIRFYFDGHFNRNELVNCRLYLPLQMTSVKAQGHIIEKPHLQTGEHVILFNKINEFDRDKIIKKCFEIEAMKYREYQ